MSETPDEVQVLIEEHVRIQLDRQMIALTREKAIELRDALNTKFPPGGDL